MALKEIWEALDGPNWKYYGEAAPMGCNWNFDKEIDMWGYQPGVQLLDNGRVASIVISGFGANGIVPDAIGQLTELRILNLGAHDELVGGHLFKDVNNMTQEQRLKIRMDYEQKFLYRDVREGLSDILIDGINANPNFKPIVKSNRIDKERRAVWKSANKITGISKALMRCTKLENFFIANSPIVADNFCTKLVDDASLSAYREAFEEEEEEWSWNNFTMLTDMEIYNCKELTTLPMNILAELPELQMLNVACNQKIPGDVLLENWNDFIDGKSGDKKIQVLYLGYNKHDSRTPEHDQLKDGETGLDVTSNEIKYRTCFR